LNSYLIVSSILILDELIPPASDEVSSCILLADISPEILFTYSVIVLNCSLAFTSRVDLHSYQSTSEIAASAKKIEALQWWCLCWDMMRDKRKSAYCLVFGVVESD